MLMALRKVHGYPLWVTVGMRKADILQPSLEGLEWNALTGVLFTLIILAAMEQILRSEAGAKQKSEQLKLTLEHMNQGIMLVTKDHDIPVINKRCGELLELPTDFIDHPLRLESFAPLQIGQSSNSFDADLAMAPENGPSAPGANVVFEHTRPDGTVIEALRTPLPEGGFIQTFTDVTEATSGRRLYRQTRVRGSADWVAESAGLSRFDRKIKRFRRAEYGICRAVSRSGPVQGYQ